MAFGDTEYDESLKKAWSEFCDSLKRSADDLFRDPIRITSPEERAEAFRYLAQSAALAFDWHIENEQMPLHPWLMHLFKPTKKMAGDKSMSMDYGAYIDGRHTYRIVGTRGTSAWIALTALRRGDASDPSSPVNRWQEPYALVLDTEPLIGPDIETEWDGSFGVILAPEPQPGKNWLRTTPETCHVRVRQLFNDWNREEPMSIRIERVGGEPGNAPPPLLHPDRMVEALGKAGEFVRKASAAWGPPPTDERAENEMRNLPVPPTRIGGIDANPGGSMATAWWTLARDEALVLEFAPVPCEMWCIELENVWWCTPDYRWRLVEVTDKQAVLEEDGTCRVVAAHRDPGVPNWLDCSGYSEGRVRYRGLLAEGAPVWSSRVVKLADLSDVLPANAMRIDADARRQQIASRAAGVEKRYRE